jgi:phosphoglycerate-specific signal transduction histidine kinase
MEKRVRVREMVMMEQHFLVDELSWQQYVLAYRLKRQMEQQQRVSERAQLQQRIPCLPCEPS